MATKKKAASKRKTPQRETTKKRAKAPSDKPASDRKVEPNPDPGPMDTNESLNVDSGQTELAVPFQPGEEIAAWPLSAPGVQVPKGQEPEASPYASFTVHEDCTINPNGLGKGDWLLGGPAGYQFEDRFVKVKVK